LWTIPILSSIDQIASDYDKGVMPFLGGSMQQPARLMQAIRLHKRAIHKAQEVIEERKHFQQGVSDGK